MRRDYQLNPANPQLTMSVDFTVYAISIVNFTPSPVYVRTGAPGIPNGVDADITVPAAVAVTYPVRAREFGAAIATVSLIPTVSLRASGLFDTVKISLLSQEEIIPSYGSVSFLALSLSELTAGVVSFSGTTTSSVFDLGPWGGLLVTLFPGATSGQGVVSVQVSSDATTWNDVGFWSFWRNTPAVITVPRGPRYARVILNSTAIPGEPAITGGYHVRATIAEIQDVSYNPVGTAISTTYSIAAVGETDIILATVGLKAISVSITPSNTGSGKQQLIVETSLSPLGGWTFVFQREQFHSTLNTLYQSIGGLSLYTRIRLLNTGTPGTNTGTVSFAIQPEPDESAVLRNIYAALGDVAETTNTNQDIYHELDNIRIADQAIVTPIGTINTNIGTINGNIIAMAASEASIDSKTSTIITRLTSILTDLETPIQSYQFGVAVTAATWTMGLTGLPASFTITGIMVTFKPGGAVGGCQIGVATSTIFAGTLAPFLQGYFTGTLVGGNVVVPYISLASPYGSGIFCSSPTNNIAVYAGVTGDFLVTLFGR